jgi:hypothetical protein
MGFMHVLADFFKLWRIHYFCGRICKMLVCFFLWLKYITKKNSLELKLQVSLWQQSTTIVSLLYCCRNFSYYKKYSYMFQSVSGVRRSYRYQLRNSLTRSHGKTRCFWNNDTRFAVEAMLWACILGSMWLQPLSVTLPDVFPGFPQYRE